MPATKYSIVTIDTINFMIDPDSVSVSTQNLISVEKSMAGTTYMTYYAATQDQSGYLRNVSVSGVLCAQADAEALQNLANSKAAIKITISGGGNIAGISAAKSYVVQSVSTNPSKPRIRFPTETGTNFTDFQYQYTISLVEVD